MNKLRDIMHQTRDPEERSVAALYQDHAQMILAYIRPRVNTKEDAEDLLVEVFLAAMQSQTPLSLSQNEQLTWLRHVARNKIIDRYRHQKRLPATSSLDEFAEILLDDDERTPEALAMRGADHAQLRTHLASLPHLQQEILASGQ